MTDINKATTKNIKSLYNKVGSEWRKKVWVNDKDMNNEILQFSNLDGNDTILDVGCGAGDFSSILPAKHKIGVDNSQSMLDVCKKLHPDYVLINCNGEELPFSDGRFDVVCCRNYLQNFINSEKAFKEMVRVCKQNGNIIIVESAVFENEREFPTNYCRVAEPFHPLFPCHEQLLELFNKNKLTDIHQIIFGIRKKWLAKQQASKSSTLEQRVRAYNICEDYPDWYKKKYEFKFFPDDLEIESRLTFSFIKAKRVGIS